MKTLPERLASVTDVSNKSSDVIEEGFSSKIPVLASSEYTRSIFLRSILRFWSDIEKLIR